MAEKDLISLANRTTEEQQRIARMGGIASGKSRRSQRTISERIKIALKISTNEHLRAKKKEIRELWPNRHTSGNKEQLKIVIAQTQTIKECGIDVYKILKIAESPETQEIALKATNALWDREEGRPNQTSNVNHSGAVPTRIIRDDIK